MIGPLNGWNGNKKHKYMFVHIAEQITVIHIDQVCGADNFLVALAFDGIKVFWLLSLETNKIILFRIFH